MSGIGFTTTGYQFTIGDGNIYEMSVKPGHLHDVRRKKNKMYETDFAVEPGNGKPGRQYIITRGRDFKQTGSFPTEVHSGSDWRTRCLLESPFSDSGEINWIESEAIGTIRHVLSAVENKLRSLSGKKSKSAEDQRDINALRLIHEDLVKFGQETAKLAIDK